MSQKNNQDADRLFEGWAFGKINYILFCAGILLVIFGYFFMANGSVSSFQSLTLSPIMLFLGYIVVLPIALVYRDKEKRD